MHVVVMTKLFKNYYNAVTIVVYILKNVISLVVNRVEIRHVISLVVNRVEIRQEKRHVCVNVAYNRPKSEKSPVLAALTLAARCALPLKGQLAPKGATSP